MVSPAQTNPSRVLFECPSFTVFDYECRRRDRGLTEEFQASYNSIVFPRRGVFIKQIEGEEIIADVNHAVFFRRGETFRFRHPCGCGDRVTEISPSEALLEQLEAESGWTPDQCDQRTPPLRAAPVDATSWFNHRTLASHLEHVACADPLAIEEHGLTLIVDALGAARRVCGSQRRTQRRNGTDQAHRTLVDRTRLLLLSEYRKAHTIDSVARRVSSSPFHLCRVFRQFTGTTIHSYLTMVRLRAGFDELMDRHMEIAPLAIRLGFSSHSHFTCAFRRAFGVTPGELRVRRPLSGWLKRARC